MEGKDALKKNVLFYSTEPGAYHGWQSDLLLRSFWSSCNNDEWSVVRAVAVYPDASHVSPAMRKTLECGQVDIFYHQSYANYLKGADCYTPYNKIIALKEWIESNEPNEERFITLIDPDFVIFRPLTPSISTAVEAEVWTGLDPKSNFGTFLGEYLGLGSRWEETPSIGVPVTLNERTLRTILPDWLRLTQMIRHGFNNGELKIDAYSAWCAEMWGFMASLCVHNIDIEVTKRCNFVYEDNLDGISMIHYCHSVINKHGATIWDKRWYEAGKGGPFRAELAAGKSGEELLRVLNG